MKPKGVLYQSGKSSRNGELAIALTGIERAVYKFLQLAGASLIVFSLAFAFILYTPVIIEELKYTIGGGAQNPTLSRFEGLLDIAEAEKTKRIQEETQYLGLGSYFSIYIPKIDARSNVIANVDPASEEEYSQALSDGVAHARGTYFPGQGRTIYLFSHSTDSAINVSRYNAVFYLLRKLEQGDKIILYFADRKYIYQVNRKQVVDANDVSWFDLGKSEGEKLVLQTCDPPGTTWKRLIIVAEPQSLDN